MSRRVWIFLALGLVIFLVGSCFLVSLSAQLNPPPPPAVLVGKLLLQRLEAKGDDPFISAGFYELQKDSREPQKLADPGFDATAVTAPILQMSRDKRYLIVSPNLLLDAQTGKSMVLPTPGLEGMPSDFHVWNQSFSPDGSRLSYTVTDPKFGLFVLNLADMTAKRMAQGDCDNYSLTGKECQQIINSGWIDADTLMFAHHKGLPASYKVGTEDDPLTVNHITMMTADGQVVQSMASSPHRTYSIIGGTVFAGGMGGDSLWFDSAELRGGSYLTHTFPASVNDAWGGPTLKTISPDGRYMVVLGDQRSTPTPAFQTAHLIDVRAGTETRVGTRYGVERTDACLWSPDGTQVACMVVSRSGKRELLLIPLSDKGNAVLLSGPKDGPRWALVDWRP